MQWFCLIGAWIGAILVYLGLVKAGNYVQERRSSPRKSVRHLS